MSKGRAPEGGIPSPESEPTGGRGPSGKAARRRKGAWDIGPVSRAPADRGAAEQDGTGPSERWRGDPARMGKRERERKGPGGGEHNPTARRRKGYGKRTGRRYDRTRRPTGGSQRDFAARQANPRNRSSPRDRSKMRGMRIRRTGMVWGEFVPQRTLWETETPPPFGSRPRRMPGHGTSH